VTCGFGAEGGKVRGGRGDQKKRKKVRNWGGPFLRHCGERPRRKRGGKGEGEEKGITKKKVLFLQANPEFSVAGGR